MAENNLAKGTIYLTLASLAVVLSNYLINIGVARFLGIELYGVFGILTSLFFINSIFLNTGVPLSVSKFMAESKYSFSAIFRSSLVLQLVLTVFLVLFYLIFSRIISVNLLNDPSLTNYLILVGVAVVPLSFLSLYTDGFFSGLRDFKKQAAIKIIYSFLRIILVIFFLALGFKLYGVLAGFFLSAIVCLLLSILLFKKKKYLEISKGSAEINMFQLLKFSTPLVIASLAFTFTRSVNVLFIKGIIQDNVQVGLFTAASTLSNISYVAFSALPITLLPSISKAVSEKNIDLTRKYISNAVRYLILFLFPVTAVVSATSTELITLFYPSEFMAAGAILSILIISFTFLSLYSSLRIIIIGSGKPKIEMLISVFSFIILIILNLILIPSKGIYGAALASLYCSIISLAIICSYIFVKFKTLISIISFLRISLISIVVYLFAYFWHYSGIWLLFSYLVLFILYLLLLYLFGELKKEDFNLWLSLTKFRKA